jgi:tricorn protease
LFYQQGRGVYSVAVSGSAGGATTSSSTSGRSGVPFPAPGATAPPGTSSGASSGSSRRVNFTVTLTIDKSAEWKEMFGDAWRTMKYRFYDPKLHGVDWEAARAKYEPIVAHVADRQELMNLINEMIGELNASHTGAAAASQTTSGDSAARVQTLHLGIDLAPDEASGKYKVTHVFEEGPADKDWIKVSVGDYLVGDVQHPALRALGQRAAVEGR